VTASGNTGRGFQFSLTKYNDSTPPIDVLFERCEIKSTGSFGISLSGSGHGGFPAGGRLELRDIAVSDTGGSGILIENKNGGPAMVLRNISLFNVATTNGHPIWIEGQAHECGGAYFAGVVVHDTKQRQPVQVLGQVADMNGTITVHNPVLPPGQCAPVRPLSNVFVVCDQNGSRTRSRRAHAQPRARFAAQFARPSPS
jgi:hypothetical protein